MPFRIPFKKSKTKSGSPERNGVVTLTKVEQLIESKLTENDFYEIELVEVLETFLKPTVEQESETSDYSYVGAVRGRYVLSEQGKPFNECGVFRPLNPNINVVPIKHELVLGIKLNGEHFYMSPLNVFGNPTYNIQPNVSDIKSKNKIVDLRPFERIDDSRKLAPYEGDVIIEGRYNNSIRLGSYQYNQHRESANIKLVAGHLYWGDSEDPQKSFARKDGRVESPVIEDIDADGASIYLTTNERLKFTPARESEVEGCAPPFQGKHILLNSKRITLNTPAQGSITMMSSKNISLSAVEMVVLETPSFRIGRHTADQPQVLGQILVDKIQALVDAIGNVVGIPTPTGPTAGPINTAPSWPAVDAAMAQIKDCLSTKHLIDE